MRLYLKELRYALRAIAHAPILNMLAYILYIPCAGNYCCDHGEGEKRKRTTCTVALTQEQEAFKKSLLDRAATSKKKGIGHSDANYEEMFQLDPDVHQHIKFCDDFKGDEPELKSLKDGELSFYCIPCNKYDNSIPLF
jgi:hypothetical protein